MDLPPCPCTICVRARDVGIAQQRGTFDHSDLTGTISPVTSVSNGPSLPIATYAASGTASDLASLTSTVNTEATGQPITITSPRTFSGLSTTSTDTAYSHLSYCPDIHRTSWSENSFILAEVLTLSPEDTDTEEAHLINTDDVPSLVDTETQEDLDDDSEGSFDDYFTVDLTNWSVYPADDDWEYIHLQDGLIPPPPSPRLFPRKANTLPLLSYPSSTLAALVLFSLMKPVSSTATPDADENLVELVMLSSPYPVTWVPCKPWPVWVTLLLAVGTAFWFLLNPYVSDGQVVPQEVMTQEVIANDDLFVPSVAVPLGGIAMERTRRSSGYPRGRIWELGKATDLSRINHGVGPRGPRTATVATASVALLAPAATASPTSCVPRLATQSMQFSAFAIVTPIVLIAMIWAIRARLRVSTTASQSARRSQTTSALWLIPALSLTPAVMAESTFTLAQNFETSNQTMSPGTIAAIALGTAAILFVLPLLAKVFVAHRAVQHTRLYQYAVIAVGVTLGLTVGLVLMPLFAVYMVAVFVAAVTASYARWAGLDTTGWWQGQTTQWPSRLMQASLSETDLLEITPFVPPSETSLEITPSSPTTIDNDKGGMLRHHSEALPLPVYPPRAYARSLALVVLIALAMPRSAPTSAHHSLAPSHSGASWEVA
ncbi:hypothetical protein CspHIS471_0105710 [Cutaneotrichosporon sp. HIS471]|nr:hypothetical protein CspHIS471_0105710 [Cutaneotrichosporon sp. HIS471]